MDVSCSGCIRGLLPPSCHLLSSLLAGPLLGGLILTSGSVQSMMMMMMMMMMMITIRAYRVQTPNEPKPQTPKP